MTGLSGGEVVAQSLVANGIAILSTSLRCGL